MWTSAETGGGAPHAAHGVLGDDDAFDLPPLDAFPRHAEPFQSFPTHQEAEEEDEDAFDRSFDDQRSVHSEEFVDAEAYLEDHKPGEDSFLREATGGEANAGWSDDEDMADATDRRASAIFVPKSRNMEHVEFSSPKRSMRKAIDADRSAPLKTNVRANRSQRASNAAFSTTNTALSSEYDIHLDNRLALTPNSFKYLQQLDRQPTHDFTLSGVNGSTYDNARDSHTVQARQVVDASAISELPRVPGTPARPSSAERAMQAGPGMIKKALHEIESMLLPVSFDEGDSDPEYNPALDKLRSRLQPVPRSARAPRLTNEASRTPDIRTFGPDLRGGVSRPAMKNEGAQAGYSPVSAASVQVTHRSQITNEPREYVLDADVNETAREPTAVQEQGVMTISSLRPHSPTSHVKLVNTVGTSAPKDTDAPADAKTVSQPTQHVRTADAWTQPEAIAKDREAFPTGRGAHVQPVRPKEHRPEISFRRASLRGSLDAPLRSADVSERENVDVNVSVRTRTQPRLERKELGTVRREKDGTESTSIKATVNSLPLATSLPSQMARRCRRFLCVVGERLNEQIVFSNGSTKVGRICVSLLPLSTGCQQFSVSPAVLELQPRSRSAFTVTFEASHAGVVAGIFQFRAVGVDGLFEPYEVLIEASVRGDLKLPPALPHPKARKTPTQAIKSHLQNDRVTELPAQALASVKITPTFLRFTNTNDNPGQDTVVGGSSIRITNTTADSIHFQLKNSHEHLQLSQARGELPAGSEVKIEVRPICRPFGVNDDATRDWCGSMTVIVGDVLSREVSIVIERNALCALPSFDEVARVRQAISAQTDSFYYTKKVNRRGLYFHARAVECGSCVVGESHQVPVYICNGSESPMTVFLQALQEPFSCEYQPTTLQARKFIEVPVTFRPKATGKVATCLVAYTVSGKAAVTLIARGVDKTSAVAREEN